MEMFSFRHSPVSPLCLCQVFDKAVDEPSYSCMYAQLCVRLNEFAPDFEEAGSQTTVSASCYMTLGGEKGFMTLLSSPDLQEAAPPQVSRGV